MSILQMGIVKIQPSETLPSLTLSLWNVTPKLTMSQVTVTDTKKQICADRSKIDIANIKGTLLFFLFFFSCLFSSYVGQQ